MAPIAEARRTSVMIVGDHRIDRRVLDQARTLINNGWQVTVIAAPAPSPGDRQDEECYPDVEIVRIDGDRTIQLLQSLDKAKLADVTKAFGEWDYFKLLPFHGHFLVEAIIRPAAVYTAHDLPQLPAAAMAARWHDAYLAYDAHELYPQQAFKDESLIPVYTEIDAFLSPFADAITTVNESLAEEMATCYAIRRPGVILNAPAVDPNDLPIPNHDLFRHELGIPADKKILLFQGNMGKRVRNLENLVGAMGHIRHDDVVLVLMGSDHGVVQDLHAIAAGQGTLGSRVLFRSPVPQNVLLSYTASADAGVIPYPPVDRNSYFCTPNKLFEFIAAGLPILANDLPELRRFIGGQNIGLNYAMTDVQAVAHSIDAFFSGPIDVWKENVRSLASSHVWRSQEKTVVHLYESLLSGNRKAFQSTIQAAEASIFGGNLEAARHLLAPVLAYHPGNLKALVLMAELEKRAGNTNYFSNEIMVRLTAIAEIGARRPGSSG